MTRDSIDAKIEASSTVSRSTAVYRDQSST